jgi:hypothetical protein
MSKIILRLEKPAIASGIPENQFGVGQSWGGEKMVCMT